MTQIFRLFFLSFCALTLAACQTAPPKIHDNGLTTAQILALEEFGFAHIDEGMSYDLSGKILFETDSSDLSSEAREVITRVSSLLKEIGIHSLKLEGHTDNRGSDEYNQRLSEQRAQSVANEVIAQGFEANHLKVVGYGPRMPVASNDTEEGRAENRRVTIVVGVAGNFLPVMEE